MKINIRQLIFLATLAGGCALMIAGIKTVNVKVPGTLSQLVGEKNKYTTKSLKIKGALNADDVCFLRDMTGVDSIFNSTPGILTDIDLSEVSFIPGPKSFIGDNWKYRIKGSHSIPSTFLYKCPVEKIVLPQKLDSIGSWAFSTTRLKELYVPDGVYIGKAIIAADSLLTDLRLPASTKEAITPSRYGLPGIKKISLGNVDYISSNSFSNLPDLEEIVFEGMIGHIDGYAVSNCPKLKRIIFRGPVASTGGTQFVKDCPELEEVRFEGLVFITYFGEPVNCPKLKQYDTPGVVLYADSTIFHVGKIEDIQADPKMVADAKKILENKTRSITNPKNNFLERLELNIAEESLGLAEALNDTAYITAYNQILAPVKEELKKTKLQILKRSPGYKKDDIAYEWSYTAPSDSILTLDREYFNLDSIAGNGDDISRIKNLMYWVHDAVNHDGNSFNPDSESLIDLYEICHKENRGVNCRMMAIMLTEALLAEGIPARYLTCQPKYWKFDSDCHVICMAWSESLGKWIWVDPTFAAFVTDENGLMLHPGEVRERLIEGKELILNPDANWNHKDPQTKEGYLDNYMAKNLYYITAITHNRPRPEGTGSSSSKYIILAPEGADTTPRGSAITTDYERFWAKPEI